MTDTTQQNKDFDMFRDIDPNLITPPHDIREDDEYVKLVYSIWTKGWRGRPLLVMDNEDGRLQALTGSHRLAAAVEVGLDSIPVHTFNLNTSPKLEGLDPDEAEDEVWYFLDTMWDDMDKTAKMLRDFGFSAEAHLLEQDEPQDDEEGV